MYALACLRSAAQASYDMGHVRAAMDSPAENKGLVDWLLTVFRDEELKRATLTVMELLSFSTLTESGLLLSCWTDFWYANFSNTSGDFDDFIQDSGSASMKNLNPNSSEVIDVVKCLAAQSPETDDNRLSSIASTAMKHVALAAIVYLACDSLHEDRKNSSKL